MTLDELLVKHAHAVLDLVHAEIKDMKKLTKAELYEMIKKYKDMLDYDYDIVDDDNDYVSAKDQFKQENTPNCDLLAVAAEAYALANELENYGTDQQKIEFVRAVANSSILADNHAENPTQCKVISDGTLNLEL